MTSDDVRELFGDLLDKDKLWLDYVQGRPIKVGLERESLLRSDLYDRDASPGACARIVASLRAGNGAD